MPAENNSTINDIQPVNIGSAATFRETINNNFDIIKNNWVGAYVGSDQAQAGTVLATNGIWIKTSEVSSS